MNAPTPGLMAGMGQSLDPVHPALPLLSTTAAMRERAQSSHADAAAQLAVAMRTSWGSPVLDAGRVLSSPRSGVGYTREVTGTVVAEWARTQLPAFRHLDGDGYARCATLYVAWARQAEADRLAALPADQRRADEIRAERAREDRRAELERARAEAERELAELDGRTTS